MFFQQFHHPEKILPEKLFLSFLLDGLKNVFEEQVFGIYYNLHIYLSVSCHRKDSDCFGVMFPNKSTQTVVYLVFFSGLMDSPLFNCLFQCFLGDLKLG